MNSAKRLCGSISFTFGWPLAIALFLLPAAPLIADELVAVKRLSLQLAGDIADAAVSACRAKGYQVTAVVVDREGIPQVVMRDVLAPRFTLQIAEEKANAVILSGISSGEFRRNRGDIREEMNHVDGILVLAGAVPITGGGALLGAVGVSGAPGGERDEACAREAVESVRERLEFAD